MDTALPQKFPFILDRNLAKANSIGNRVFMSCDTVVLARYQKTIREPQRPWELECWGKCCADTCSSDAGSAQQSAWGWAAKGRTGSPPGAHRSVGCSSGGPLAPPAPGCGGDWAAAWTQFARKSGAGKGAQSGSGGSRTSARAATCCTDSGAEKKTNYYFIKHTYNHKHTIFMNLEFKMNNLKMSSIFYSFPKKYKCFKNKRKNLSS